MVVARVHFKARLISGTWTCCGFLPQRLGLVRWWLSQLVSIYVHTIQLQVMKQALFIYTAQRGSP
jgi:hypothetical protein